MCGKENVKEKKTILYSRGSSNEQKEDLKRQKEDLENWSRQKGYQEIESISEIGSGINYTKRGLKKLLKEIISGKVKRIVLTYKDRLERFGIELLNELCRLKEIEIEIIQAMMLG